MKTLATCVIGCLVLTSSSLLAQKDRPQLKESNAVHGRTMTLLADEVRHQLMTLPYYGVFDWLEARVLPDDTVVLSGQVVRDSTKKDAESRVSKLEAVSKVTNEIEILPASQNDEQIRRAVYRAIYKFDSPLFQYAERASPPIHIIVKGGHVTLKGAIGSDMDKQLAFNAASGVSNVFDVQNDLVVDK